MVSIGQIWRDTHSDGMILRGKPHRNGRTVEILSQETDGRWLALTLTDTAGRPARPRKSRLKASTLASGYELQTPGPAMEGGR